MTDCADCNSCFCHAQLGRFFVADNPFLRSCRRPGAVRIGYAWAAGFPIGVFSCVCSLLADIGSSRDSRELQINRDLADNAETSRFAELRRNIEKQEAFDAELKTDLLVRMEKLDCDLRSAVETAGNTLSAYIGELEDRSRVQFAAPLDSGFRRYDGDLTLPPAPWDRVDQNIEAMCDKPQTQ